MRIKGLRILTARRLAVSMTLQIRASALHYTAAPAVPDDDDGLAYFGVVRDNGVEGDP